MTREQFKTRARACALRAIKVAESLPADASAQIIGRQLVRSATSTAANYRAAMRSKSRADLVAKMGVVEEECDESPFWLEPLTDPGKIKPASLTSLMRERDGILPIVVASIKTARRGS